MKNKADNFWERIQQEISIGDWPGRLFCEGGSLYDPSIAGEQTKEVDMLSLVAQHGTDENVEYVTCAIQDRPMKQGGKLIASRVFDTGDYDDDTALTEAVVTWIQT